MARDFASQYMRHARRKRVRRHRHQGNRHNMAIKGKAAPRPVTRY